MVPSLLCNCLRWGSIVISMVEVLLTTILVMLLTLFGLSTYLIYGPGLSDVEVLLVMIPLGLYIVVAIAEVLVGVNLCFYAWDEDDFNCRVCLITKQLLILVITVMNYCLHIVAPDIEENSHFILGFAFSYQFFEITLIYVFLYHVRLKNFDKRHIVESIQSTVMYPLIQ